MSTIPENVLENLKCFFCNGYLSSAPVVVNQKKQQICSKCYKILPQSEKNRCLRQISYETIASTMTFPCKYFKVGCDFTFEWNMNDTHESECSKRYFTYPDVININNESKYEENNSGKIKPGYDPDNRTYDNVIGNDISQQNRQQCQHYGSTSTVLTNISDDTTITKPLIPPEPTSRKNNPVYENFYETLPSIKTTTENKCSNCQSVLKDDIFNCLFGHVTCEKCKGEMCLVCFKNHDGSTRKCCKNVSRGCKVKLLEVDAAHHRDNCEFNVLSCPIETCDVKDIIDNLKIHVREHHSDSVYEKNEFPVVLNKQDKVFVCLIFDSMFKCAYYYYSTYVEVFVTYLGPCEKARHFMFEASVFADAKFHKKRREVANWNNNMLASGVSFDKKELVNNGEKKFSFKMDIKIFHSNYE